MNEDGLAAEKGKVPFVSSEGINQLHIFIFVLAVFHVLYCILTMALGRLKMRRWKHWEKETRTAEYQFSHGKEEDELSKANHDRANKILEKSVQKLCDLLLASTSGMNEDGLAAEKSVHQLLDLLASTSGMNEDVLAAEKVKEEDELSKANHDRANKILEKITPELEKESSIKWT